MTPDSVLLHTAAQLLDARIGLKPELSFRPHLARALRDVAATMNIDREELVAALATNASLFDALLNRITVQESGFFRHPEQFEVLTRVVLPMIRTPFRAWSAASANGQEAYSLAMIMNETSAGGSVFASDVSPAALQRTAVGSYKEREMGGVSVDRRRRHFLRIRDGWQVQSNIREMITVQRHNLLDPIPRQVSACQVVMCRNVLIYFKQLHAEMFLARLADAMDPKACLFVGAAETLWQITDRFEPSQIGVSYVYRPLPRGSSPATRTSVSRLPVPGSLPMSTPPPVAPAPPVEEPDQDHGQLGRELLASGYLDRAIVAFRRWTYMSPDDPTSHFQLGSALDAAHQRVPAVRAYRAALAALSRSDAESVFDVLHGYDPAELRRLLEDRCLAASDDAATPAGSSPLQREAPTVRL
jgi:chemotaxis protein methyltransferase CheR